jgi:hypothetical protein
MMQFEPGSSHVAHVSVSNLARKPYSYELTFTLVAAGVTPLLLGARTIELGAVETDVVDMPITFWDVEGETFIQVSAYETTKGVDLGVILEEPVDLAVVSPPAAAVTIYWD